MAVSTEERPVVYQTVEAVGSSIVNVAIFYRKEALKLKTNDQIIARSDPLFSLPEADYVSFFYTTQ